MKKKVVWVVIPRNDRFLLAQRALDDCAGGTWTFPGGKVDNEDKTPIEAARRELKEEVGLVGTRFRKLYGIDLGNYNTQVFLCDSWIGQPLPSCKDIIGIGWFTLPEIHIFNKSLFPFVDETLMYFTYLLQHYRNHHDEWHDRWEDV